MLGLPMQLRCAMANALRTIDPVRPALTPTPQRRLHGVARNQEFIRCRDRLAAMRWTILLYALLYAVATALYLRVPPVVATGRAVVARPLRDDVLQLPALHQGSLHAAPPTRANSALEDLLNAVRHTGTRVFRPAGPESVEDQWITAQLEITVVEGNSEGSSIGWHK